MLLGANAANADRGKDADSCATPLHDTYMRVILYHFKLLNQVLLSIRPDCCRKSFVGVNHKSSTGRKVKSTSWPFC